MSWNMTACLRLHAHSPKSLNDPTLIVIRTGLGMIEWRQASSEVNWIMLERARCQTRIPAPVPGLP